MSSPATDGSRYAVPSRIEAWLFRVAAVLVGGGGVVYGWFRYFVASDDPFSTVGHPAETYLLHLHVLAAPLLVFLLGSVWRAHAATSWRAHITRRRRTGLILLLTALPMIATGALIQVVVSETWRSIWGVAHSALGLTWCAGYAVHQWPRPRR